MQSVQTRFARGPAQAELRTGPPAKYSKNPKPDLNRTGPKVWFSVVQVQTAILTGLQHPYQRPPVQSSAASNDDDGSNVDELWLALGMATPSPRPCVQAAAMQAQLLCTLISLAVFSTLYTVVLNTLNLLNQIYCLLKK